MIIASKVSTDRFTWLKEDRKFVSELSSLKGVIGRVYDDAADYGFILVSARTGVEKLFTNVGESYQNGKLVSMLFTEVRDDGSFDDSILIEVFND